MRNQNIYLWSFLSFIIVLNSKSCTFRYILTFRSLLPSLYFSGICFRMLNEMPSIKIWFRKFQYFVLLNRSTDSCFWNSIHLIALSQNRIIIIFISLFSLFFFINLFKTYFWKIWAVMSLIRITCLRNLINVLLYSCFLIRI